MALCPAAAARIRITPAGESDAFWTGIMERAGDGRKSMDPAFEKLKAELELGSASVTDRAAPHGGFYKESAGAAVVGLILRLNQRAACVRV